MQKAKTLKLESIAIKQKKEKNMVIKTIDEMEKFVSSNKNFSWDGWTVVRTYKSDKARTSTNGVCINGQWLIQERFVPGIDGWVIPESIVANGKA
jgi:hypothetical protein